MLLVFRQAFCNNHEAVFTASKKSKDTLWLQKIAKKVILTPQYPYQNATQIIQLISHYWKQMPPYYHLKNRSYINYPILLYKIIKRAVHYLNLGETSVDVCDQLACVCFQLRKFDGGFPASGSGLYVCLFKELNFDNCILTIHRELIKSKGVNNILLDKNLLVMGLCGLANTNQTSTMSHRTHNRNKGLVIQSRTEYTSFLQLKKRKHNFN